MTGSKALGPSEFDRLPISASRLRRFAVIRLAILVAMAIVAVLIRTASAIAVGPLLATIGLLGATSVVVLASLRTDGGSQLARPAGTRLTRFLVGLDIVGLTAIIHFSGGAENPFFPLYAFPIVIAAAFLGRAAGRYAAASAALLYAIVIVGESQGWLPHHHLLQMGGDLTHTGVYGAMQIAAVAITCILASEGANLLVGFLRQFTRDLAADQRRADDSAAGMRDLNSRLSAANLELQHRRAHLDAAYAELQTAYDRLQNRSSHMSELNEQLRLANAECKARREELAQVNEKLREALGRLETRTEHMGELNELLRAANAECRAKRDDLERVNAELALANRKLIELEDVRAQFTLLTTHELRAPVAAIQSYLKLILEGYVPQPKVRETLEKAERRAMEQLALIADLLELGRIGSADARGLVQPVQIEALLREQLELLAASARERGITIETHVGEKLDAVRANPDQIRSLWNNLISNAIKYNRDAGHVTVTLVQEDRRLVGSVADTGIGIPEEAMSRLFSEFFRADNAKAQSRMGTGLGLSIVKEIVERGGGQITVESEIDKGTTFHFWLPVVQAARPSEEQPEPDSVQA